MPADVSCRGTFLQWVLEGVQSVYTLCCFVEAVAVEWDRRLAGLELFEPAQPQSRSEGCGAT